MSAHTPGPWVCDERGLAGDGAAIGDAKGRRLAHTSAVRNLAGKWLDPEQHIEPAEALANARLMAAAPELLEALKAVRDAGLLAHAADCEVHAVSIGIMEPSSPCDCNRDALPWRQVEAAIAKAEGGR